MVLNNFIKAACLSTCLGLASGSVLANANYNIDTNGGLRVYDKSNTDHWFKLNGNIKFDQSLFHAQDSGAITSSTNLRGVKATLSGGLGSNTSYKLKLSNGSNGLSVDNAVITYSGFNNWSKVSVGQVDSPYGLENASDTSFLERSIATNVFSPESGLGFNVQAWTDKVGLALSVIQPGDNITNTDQLSFSTRLAWAPINTDNLVLHLGLSSRYQAATLSEEVQQSSVRFSTNLEVRGRNLNSLDTGRIRSTSFKVGAADVALQRGPVLLQAEYHHANISKSKAKDISLYGWNVQASYAVTGESREYNYRDGGFKNVQSVGGWEVSLRHSFVNLQRDDVDGGNAHTFGGSVSWAANENLRVLANYIHSPVTPAIPENGEGEGKNNLGALAVRLQATW